MFTGMVIIAAAVGTMVPATAPADKNDILARAFTTPDAAAIRVLAEGEMKELRGAAGVVFGGTFSSVVEGAAIGDIPEGWNVSTLGDSQVAIQAGFGSFEDFTGVLQLANVVGNFNVVRNIMNLNVTINNQGGTLSLR